MHRWFVSIVVALTTVVTASAQTLYIPASANAEGVNQTRWRTDLQVKAQGGQPAAFTVELLESRADNRNPVSLAFSLDANESLRLGNVLSTEFGYTGTAALRVTATEGRITATSRTYNDDPGGTYGQTVPAVAAEEGVGPGSQSTMILLSRSSDPSIGFRTNLGLVNLTGSSTAVDIDVHDAAGAIIGSLSRSLKPFEHRQFNDVFDLVGAGDVADGYAVVRTTTQGGSFLAYASVVDNGSGDAVFILGSADLIPTPAADRLVVFESFLRPG
jgi:hypothetical protein